MNVPKLESTSGGTYEILAKIGEGGMGSVYKVRHRLLHVVRVAKVLRTQLAESEEWQGRFLLEARRASALRHRSIAPLHEFHLEPQSGDAWMIMEFIEGCTLLDVLKHCEQPSISLVLEVARQCLDVLGYLHSRDLIHRDVSPDNVMLSKAHDGTLEAKLIDLGIAKRVGEESVLTAAGSFMGKYRYSSPEQLDTSVPVDPRSDLYSVGLTIYQLATGMFPLKGETPPELAAAHWRQPPIAFSESDPEGRVPERLREILLRSLEKDPEDRFPTAREFAAAVNEVEVDEEPDPGELERLLDTAAQAAPAASAGSVPASTQIRLDRAFGAEGTPASATRADEILRRNEALELAAAAEGEMAVGGHRAAVSKLRRALSLDPSNEDVERQLALAEAEVQRGLKVETAVQRVEALLEEGRLDAAAKNLVQAAARIGQAEAFEALETRIASALRQRSSKVARLLGQAQRLWKAGDLDKALEAVQAALALDSADREGRRLNHEIREAMERHSAVAKALEAIKAELATSRLESAQGLYRQAAEEFGKDERLELMRDQLEVAAKARQDKVTALLDKAAALGEAGKLEEASEAARAALELDPASSRTSEVLADLRAALERQREINERVARVRKQLAVGEAAGAASTLAETESLFGSFEGLPALQRQLRELETSIRKGEIERLVGEAQGFAGNEDWKRVAQRVRHALSLDPGKDQIGDRLDAVEAALEARRRARESMESIRALLDAGRLEEAAQRCEEGATLFGSSDELAVLRGKVEGALERRSRAQSHLQRAERLEDEGDYHAAVLELHKAAELDNRLEFDDKLAKLRQLEARGNAVRKEVERVVERLERKDLRGAGRILSRAESKYGEDEALREARRKLVASELVHTQDLLEEHLVEARNRKKSGDLPLALAAIRRAAELDPSHAEAQRLLDELQGEVEKRERDRRQVVDQLEELELEIDVDPRPRPGRRSAVGLVVGVVLALAVGTAGWRFLSWSGELRVAPVHDVQGLSIWVDGEDTGLSTPGLVPLAGRRGGAAEVALKRGSRVVASTQLQLGASAPEAWTPRVKVARNIESEPAGARVLLDGEPLDRPTPVEVELDSDPEGVHEVRLELEGYQAGTRTLALGAWSDALRVELKPVAQPGVLVIAAPYPVNVRVDGRQYSGRALSIEVAAGTYDVVLSSGDVYYSRRMQVSVSAGEQRRLVAFPQLTSVWVLAVPSNAELFIDGRRVGELPREVDLVVGPHQFEFRWPDSSLSDRLEIDSSTRQVSSDVRQIRVD